MSKNANSSWISKLLERNYALNWNKGYLVALQDFLKKFEQASKLNLLPRDQICFVMAEMKAAIDRCEKRHIDLEEIFNREKTEVKDEG